MSRKVKASAYVASKISRKKSDFKVDTFRSGKNGGQNVNKVESGVRITDLITGLFVRCTETRDQIQNKSLAMNRLFDKLLSHYRREESELLLKNATASPGTVRTYKEKNSLVIDSRLDKTYNYEEVLNGKLDDLLNDLRRELTNINDCGKVIE